ncbi:type III-A CRISPR-associated protein Csm2 [Cuniculiplasma sp. SKW4]|uniref:type III-A CRISPR-associated protein Csm2 n=1 Tax=Cuniculiplasma sp. SKW4 TaxID=3400171 RepID=UPI003FD6656F
MNERDGSNFKRQEGQAINGNNEEKILEYIRREEDMDYKSKYQLFGMEGLIKKTYCERQANDSTMNQLRRFYDQIVSIEEKTSKGEDSMSDLIRLVPIVRYANARGLVDERFSRLIDRSVEIITGQNGKNAEKSLHSFKNVMEAIVAYSKKQKGKKED